jgi:soluble lytic murein transglycosylase-like protein
MHSFEIGRTELAALTAAAIAIAGLLFVAGHVVGSSVASERSTPYDAPGLADSSPISRSIEESGDGDDRSTWSVPPRPAPPAPVWRIGRSSAALVPYRSFSKRSDGLSTRNYRPRRAAPTRLPPAVTLRSPMLAFRSGHTIPETPFGDLIFGEARRRRLNPALVAAVISVESGFDPHAVSAKGAIGLMQVIPDTATRFGVDPEQLTDPRVNVTAGTEYLRWLSDRYNGDPGLTLAAYNAGDGAVDRWGGVPPYRETRNYIRRVFSAFDTLERTGSG